MIHFDQDQARRLLDGELSQVEEQTVVQHLEQCESCRHSLEQTAGDEEAWASTRDLLKQSAEIVHWSDSVAHSDSEVSDSFLARSRVDLSILAPTDDPVYLGRIGGYEVIGVIGRGGMGIVFKAVDRSLNRNVAIKVLDPSFAGIGAARQRFAREARAMAAISHEHVVPIYSVDEHCGLPYFAMEYVAGGTLEARLRSVGALDVIATTRIALQVANALSAAHDCGLVHRDIKPANILLDRGIERVRVADFGLARIANDASYTRSGLVAGTPQFMAPEQVRGEACDARSDLFSLGSVMYAMCTGHPPFRAETVYGVMQRIVHDPPRPIREQNPNVPEWLEQFIDRLIAKDRDDRFESASLVARLLELELPHLQNPAGHLAPNREWLVRDKPNAHRKCSAAKLLSLVAIISACVLIGIAVWSFTSGVINEPQLNNASDGAVSPSTSTVPATESAVAPEDEMPNRSDTTISTWYEPDDIQEIKRRANELELRIQNTPWDDFDPWANQRRALRDRVEELLNEPL